MWFFLIGYNKRSIQTTDHFTKKFKHVLSMVYHHHGLLWTIICLNESFWGPLLEFYFSCSSWTSNYSNVFKVTTDVWKAKLLNCYADCVRDMLYFWRIVDRSSISFYTSNNTGNYVILTQLTPKYIVLNHFKYLTI